MRGYKLLKDLGADHIIPRGENFVEEVKEYFLQVLMVLPMGLY